MLQKNVKIQEVYNLEHVHDSNQNGGYDPDGRYLSNVVSPVIIRNDVIGGFVSNMEPLVSALVESSLPLRNMYNPTVDKYFDGHAK